MRTHKTAVLAVFGVFALGVLLRLPTFSRPLLSDDEAIYATTADALNRGGLLFRDVVDHKPPAVYHVYQAAFAAFGRYQMQGPHALVILAVLLTAGLLFAIKRREASDDAGGTALAAAGLFLIFSTTWHDYDALSANCELFLLPFQAGAAWMVLGDLDRPPRGARALATHAGDRPPDRNVGAVQVPGPDISGRVDRHARLVGDQRTRVRGAGRRRWPPVS